MSGAVPSGARGEELALAHLLRRGYTLIERNYRTRRGEIDLIMMDGEDLVFVEVKLRRSAGFGEPVEAVTPAKQRRLRLAAGRYLAERAPAHGGVRFDVVGVLAPAGGKPRITHVRQAFF
ncbi:YraN family protein [Rubrobacter xylanophilus]|uniref:YraN family protein n=1 Tax=Rubrobacter xylanophilus TaxID=49319 RepID=UPI0022789B72|nr:YraN family protein [Rubrobacter xylanophilus]